MKHDVKALDQQGLTPALASSPSRCSARDADAVRSSCKTADASSVARRALGNIRATGIL